MLRLSVHELTARTALHVLLPTLSISVWIHIMKRYFQLTVSFFAVFIYKCHLLNKL